MPGNTGVALSPETAGKFVKLGASVAVERGAGADASITDAAYEQAGATLGTAAETVAGADFVLGVRAPDPALLQRAPARARWSRPCSIRSRPRAA